jgi:Protein of unknown function (DUF2846)
MQKAALWKYIVLALVGVFAGQFLMAFAKGTFVESIFLWLCGFICIGFVGYVVWLLVFKNKSTLKATDAQKSEALNFLVDANMGVIYVYRKQYIAMLAGFDVVLDGSLIGQTRGYCFYRLLVSPGNHVLSGDKKCQGQLNVEVNAGQIVYVEKEILMGAMSGGYQFVINENMVKAQDLIKSCKMFLPAPSGK